MGAEAGRGILPLSADRAFDARRTSVDETEVLLRTKKDHAITQQQTSPDWRLVIGVKALFNQRWLESHYRHNQQINSVASASKPSC